MFSDKDKQIFPFPLPSGKVVYFDPLALRRRLVQACEGDLYGTLELAQPCRRKDGETDEDWKERKLIEKSPECELVRASAQERLVAATRTAFRLPEFDESTGEGATEGMCWSALNSFLEWMEKNA